MQLSSRPLANPAVVFRQVSPGEAVLVNTDTAASIVLNATGIAVWKMLDGNRGPGEIVAAIKLQFQGVPDDAIKDVRLLIEQLSDEGFVGFELLGTDTSNHS